MIEPIYHIEDVAFVCGVSIDVVKEWLDRGLRHLPLGSATTYQPRDAIVRASWLYGFLEAQSVVRPRRAAEETARPSPQPERATPRAKAAKRSRSTNMLGPCPV